MQGGICKSVKLLEKNNCFYKMLTKVDLKKESEVQDMESGNRIKLKYTIETAVAGIVIVAVGLLILFNIYKTKNLMQEVLSGKPILVERYILNYQPTTD